MVFKISTIQANLEWENKRANLRLFENAFKEVDHDAQLVILPEMFSTGFTMDPLKHAESMNGKSIEWMKTFAEKLDTTLCGSLIIEENGCYFNRLLVVNQKGEIKTYDKKHLFRYADEHQHYSAGSSHLILSIHQVKLAFFICYDLRFPVWTRNTHLKYDVAIYIANWPEARSSHWNALLKARAIENQAYTVGVNRIGDDKNGISHSGDSAVYNPKGEKISITNPHEYKVENISLDIEKLYEYRSKFPTHLDADQFKLL